MSEWKAYKMLDKSGRWEIFDEENNRKITEFQINDDRHYKDLVLIEAAPELLEAAKLALQKFKKQRKLNEKIHGSKIEKGEAEKVLEKSIQKAEGEGDNND